VGAAGRPPRGGRVAARLRSARNPRELAIDVAAEKLLDCWLYEVLPGQEVVIVTYGCRYEGDGAVRRSHEHSAAGQFDLSELDGLQMPEGYRRSIRDWHRRRR